MEGKFFHKRSCRKESYTSITCECGFTAQWIVMDHSKNIPSVTDKSFKPYDALTTVSNNGRNNMEEKVLEVSESYDQYHDPDDWVPICLDGSNLKESDSKKD